jgi:hypothetical protein
MSTDGKPAIGAPTPAERTDGDDASLERRAILRRFGVYAAATAPAMVVLMASRQSEAGGFFRKGGGGGGGGGGGSKGGCGFSC